MKIASLKWLVCPVPGCEGSLSASEHPQAIRPGPDEAELLEAIVQCGTCSAEYPVVMGAAILVPDLNNYLMAFAQEIERSARQLPGIGISAGMTRYLGFPGAFTGHAEPGPWEENLDWSISPYIQAHFDRSSLDEDLPEGWWRNSLKQFESTTDPYKFLVESALARSASSGQTGLLVEVGASVGRVSADLAAAYEFCVGVDWSFTAVLAARRLLLGQPHALEDYALELEKGQVEMRPLSEVPGQENLDFVVADGACLPFARRSAACVAALNVLCAVPQPARVMAEFSRVSEDSGLLLLSSPYWYDSGPSPFALGGPEQMKAALAQDFQIVEEREMVPWLLKIAKRRWNVYLSHCVVAARI